MQAGVQRFTVHVSKVLRQVGLSRLGGLPNRARPARFSNAVVLLLALATGCPRLAPLEDGGTASGDAGQDAGGGLDGGEPDAGRADAGQPPLLLWAQVDAGIAPAPSGKVRSIELTRAVAGAIYLAWVEEEAGTARGEVAAVQGPQLTRLGAALDAGVDLWVTVDADSSGAPVRIATETGSIRVDRFSGTDWEPLGPPIPSFYPDSPTSPGRVAFEADGGFWLALTRQDSTRNDGVMGERFNPSRIFTFQWDGGGWVDAGNNLEYGSHRHASLGTMASGAVALSFINHTGFGITYVELFVRDHGGWSQISSACRITASIPPRLRFAGGPRFLCRRDPATSESQTICRRELNAGGGLPEVQPCLTLPWQNQWLSYDATPEARYVTMFSNDGGVDAWLLDDAGARLIGAWGDSTEPDVVVSGASIVVAFIRQGRIEVWRATLP